MSNLQNAAGLVAAAGNGADTELAHFSRDELNLLNQFRGGQPDINPSTGLPQYGWLGNLLKGLVRAGATIAGGMIAGPAGAAAGSGISTKLTGGSWNDALKGAAISGIGSFAAQGLSGGGWSATAPWGAGVTAPGAAANIATPGLGAISTGAPAIGSGAINVGAMAPGVTAAAIPAGVAPSLGSAFLEVAKSAPGIVGSLGALSQPFDQMKQQPAPTTGGPHFSVEPMERSQLPYMGDPLTYGERGMHQFYGDINPPPRFREPTPGGVRYAEGGEVDPVGYNAGGAGLAGPSNAVLQQAAMQGYMAAKKGGAMRGPGTGTSDEIPAMLSNGEHIFTAHETNRLGGGDNETGQKRMYKLRAAIRKKGPAVMKGIGNLKIKPR